MTSEKLAAARSNVRDQAIRVRQATDRVTDGGSSSFIRVAILRLKAEIGVLEIYVDGLERVERQEGFDP